MKAIWNNTTIAKSDDTIEVEGNHYFPPQSINDEFFKPSDYTTECHWKGVANYYSIQVDNEVNDNAAWYYPEPKSETEHIKNYVAFWKGIQVAE